MKVQSTYSPTEIEKRWRERWEKEGLYEPDIQQATKPYYNLMMFPYPSAEGLHVGNMYAFTGSDIIGRFMRMCGFDVFEPIGLDGFGIHSENYALKIGVHPWDLAKKTEANFYRQLHETGNGYAWNAKLETYDKDYYRWTQWIFTVLFKAGLAYRAQAQVNWCPNCKTVLSDEQVVQKSAKSKIHNPKSVCERCETEVVKKKLTQWFFKITAYAQRLLSELEKMDWSEKVKVAQKNWIGKSEGAVIKFKVQSPASPAKRGESKFKVGEIEAFTTRPDTIFGVTFMVLAPEHPLVTDILDRTKGLLGQQIRNYVDDSLKKTESERLGATSSDGEGKQAFVKTGIDTGFHAINPVSGNKIPVFIADYVLGSYGTGAVMGVPGHDQRDWDFAKKYKIDIVEVIAGGDISRSAFTDEGVLVNSGEFNGTRSTDAIKIVTDYIVSNKIGSSETEWHLRDWIISRQRYWGPPIPMIFCKKCAKDGKSWFTIQQANFSGPVTIFPPASAHSQENSNREVESLGELRAVGSLSNRATRKIDSVDRDWDSAGWYPVPDEDLPLELPYIKNFKPTGTGVSPLASDKNFVKVKCPGCASEARRETDVSDTFLDSAWYFLRYPSVNEQVAGPVSGFLPVGARSLDKSATQDKSSSLRAAGNSSTAATRNLPWNPEITKKWLPVDMYIGGAEHSVLHLLYSRFLWKVFYDLGYFDFSAKSPKGQLGGPAKTPASGWEEPFTTFRAHGLLIKDGAKMSKSKGNVVNPDSYIEKYGADTLRTYLMFCGRFQQGGDFRDTGIQGMSRFLKRVWNLVTSYSGPVSGFLPVGARSLDKSATQDKSSSLRAAGNPSTAATRNYLNSDSTYLMNRTIKHVTQDIQSLEFNTAISAIMEFVNALEERMTVAGPVSGFLPVGARSLDKSATQDKSSSLRAAGNPSTAATRSKLISREEVETLLLLLAPFAPFMTEELWEKIGNKFSIHKHPWPEFSKKLAESSQIVLVVQVNGKVRDRITVSRGVKQQEAEKLALRSVKVTKYLPEGKVAKTIFVPDRLISFVTT